MNDNKYYTPSIEEFHVGFEFEKWFLDDTWVKMTTTVHDIYYIDGSIKVGEIRVKFLDHEDIERAGWESGMVIKIDTDESELVNGYNFPVSDTDDYILHHLEGNKFAIYLQHVYDENSGNWTQTDVFRGTILNFNELNFIMNRLNIKK